MAKWILHNTEPSPLSISRALILSKPGVFDSVINSPAHHRASERNLLNVYKHLKRAASFGRFSQLNADKPRPRRHVRLLSHSIVLPLIRLCAVSNVVLYSCEVIDSIVTVSAFRLSRCHADRLR